MTRFSTLFLIAVATIPFSCQQESKKEVLSISIFDKIYELENPSLRITGDLTHLYGDNTIDEESGKESYQPATLSFEGISTEAAIPLKIAKRGVTRKRICDFPPIKLKFSKDTLSNIGLSKFNTYKLVTHCIDSLESLVSKEFLVYKLYNHFTDNSFRVKKLNMIYEDVSNGKEIRKTAFLIEEDEELAHRLNASLYEGPIKALDRQQYAQMVIFQYMIGNTDWNLTNGHNMKWIQKADLPSPTPIPYDFDFCGLVNAPHASPHPQMPITSVRERLLQWRGKGKEELREVTAEFSNEKNAVLSMVNNQAGLSEDEKADISGFIESFYTEVGQSSFYE